MKYSKRAKKPPLTLEHRHARLDFAKEHMSWIKEWRSVLFSDEKKFNLDGSDGFYYYWHDLRDEKEVKMDRGGGVMIWAGISASGTTNIAWVPPKMNSAVYCELLECTIIERAEELCGEGFIFQQDNASVHRSQFTKSFLDSKNINLMNWPARSPDLNPIENLWGILARRVYSNGRQFNNVAELKDAMRSEWWKIDQNLLKNLIDSMPNRIYEVIKTNGGQTKY